MFHWHSQSPMLYSVMENNESTNLSHVTGAAGEGDAGEDLVHHLEEHRVGPPGDGREEGAHARQHHGSQRRVGRRVVQAGLEMTENCMIFLHGA